MLVEKNNANAVSELLFGAGKKSGFTEINALNRNGQTALEVARAKSYYVVSQIIESSLTSNLTFLGKRKTSDDINPASNPSAISAERMAGELRRERE